MEAPPTPWILLAGGKSSRMPLPKGLQRIGHELWIERQLRNLANEGQSTGVIVLGYRKEEYLQALPWLHKAYTCQYENFQGTFHGTQFQVVVNPQPEYGPFSSIQAGARELLQNPKTQAATLLPVDVPCPPASVWRVLEDAQSSVVIPCFQNRGGHPVRLSRNFLNQLLLCPPNQENARLDFQIKLLPRTQVQRLETNYPGVLLNMNTPMDWNSSYGEDNRRNESLR
jgi:molybdenum cofactor cytidylyltransferase